ncbi:creatininase family protein [Aliifodinibius sp. S!AR15-10]|uniref:creatininase family protein n=1 Tax=Aliifodinibius sp. S!AR15-10 TaxID=2950437 RepID=UPI0028597B42|nr:creatininase family protein [Aliifodinibius sp. S!AR15-10]MDR8394018.1 creatininase family protein [Aliifodinibius sp. S!AR15-10]
MRPYILAESNWKTLKDQPVELAILPWGATEAHNYHLPYATDIIEADRIAAEASRLAWEEGAKIMILPTIPFGVNTGQTDIKLDINLHPSTQAAILDDIIEVLDRQGIHKLLILNSHGGNNFKPMLRELGVKYPDMFLTFCNWFQAVDKSKYFTRPDGDHADEMETSLMLYFTPDLVKPLEEAGDGAAKQYRIKALNENWAWAERRWSEVTEDTGVGDPRNATAEKGAAYFENVTKKVSELFIDLANADINDLYL